MLVFRVKKNKGNFCHNGCVNNRISVYSMIEVSGVRRLWDIAVIILWLA